MPDVIRLLPDSVANQIAAGEVVQRPASVVKELLENAVDAEATRIELVVRDAGKTAIQVIDNGRGMSETDARMAFERHATSKIEKAEDIFAILTKGFRGEALASIAAVAQVDLKTRLHDEELGILLRIEGSRLTTQDYCNTPAGTSLEVKNLFYNIPARRNFLKSPNVELRHIIDEFERVALAHPDIQFNFWHNSSELFDLPAAPLRQRVVNIFGKKYNEKLVPVQEDTPLVRLHGFIGKPEFSKKTRGEQFFFANSRYIRNNYLHKAVCQAFEGLIQDGYHPSYFLFLEIDPARIDVNIHPTKTEIKFDDDRAIFSIIRTAVKHALGQFNISPSLDFESDVDFVPPLKKGQRVEPPGVTVNPHFNPFDKEPARTQAPPVSRQHREIGAQPGTRQDWEQLYRDLPEVPSENRERDELPLEEQDGPQGHGNRDKLQQIGRKYILAPHGPDLLIVHQQRAHERILYEKTLRALEQKQVPSQQLLFPVQLSFSAADYRLLQELLPALRTMGFDLDEFGGREIVINGLPLQADANRVGELLEQMLEAEKDHSDRASSATDERLAHTLARVSAIKTGSALNPEEMAHLLDELFACQSPYVSVGGKPVIINLQLEDLDKSFH